MRTIRVALLAAAGVLALPAPAHAGGPTSVLITEPGSGRASALYYESSEYRELDRLLQEGEPVAAPDGQLGRASYTVTWMVHDVAPWRLQFVHPDASGGPLVATRAMDHRGRMSERVSWMRLADGRAVTQLLEQALSASGRDASAAEAPSAPDPEPTVVERVVHEPTTDWFSLAGWRWVLPGTLAGLLLGTVVGRRRDDEALRRVLIDEHEPRVVTGSRG